MKQHPLSILLALSCLGLAACATHQPRVPEAPIKAPTPPPQVIGRVTAVNQEKGFTVIETKETPDTGTKLQARSIAGQETALLSVTPEKKSPFIIADILKGKPQPGDAVTK